MNGGNGGKPPEKVGVKNLKSDIEKVLLSEQELNCVISKLAERIDKDYMGDQNKLVLLCILKGSVVFMGELMKRITVPVEIDFMKVSSYGSGTQTSGKVNIILDIMRKDLDKCDVLIVEDIIDSGRTMAYLTEYLKLKGVKSVKTITLLDKPYRREVEFTPDYVGCEIPDEFVVGYGLDFAEKYRALPFIGVLKPEVYEN